ncbi:MAC/perforin domain-containing protein [Anditalea andensis]|uniref:MACPF domain-containing protein n=1 Tax=Anditalea andensis TaxID=1048983 RepID=A0A074L2F4_9BACT|nr:MAC/perforin domain-containing protein [Anditalea andensis]KEO74625.1 hypothetical protein EL17_02825 [Anditalea andensis]
MRKFLAICMVAGVFTSCVSEDYEPVIEVEIDRTDDNIEISNKSSFPQTDFGEFSLIGYGYDVTGGYADYSASKDKVFDLDRLLSDYPKEIYERPSYGGMSRSIESPNVEEFLKNISRRKDATKGFSLFQGTVTSSFSGEDVLSDKFVIAKHSSYMGVSAINFYPYKLEYLTEAFKYDINNSSPEQIVNKYGTHLVISALMGHKFTVMYQAETDNVDREKAARLGLSVAMSNIFGMFSGDLDNMGARSAKGNYSQKVSYKVTGGDPSTIKEHPSDGTNPPVVSIKEWLKSCTDANMALIDFNIFPLYSVVSDPVIADALKVYIDNYLQENQIKF